MPTLLTLPQDDVIVRDIISKIDYSDALNPNATKDMVIKACEEAKRYHFAAVAVFPTWIEVAAKALEGSGVPAQIPIGFPGGSSSRAVKLAEVKQGLKDGAREVDMVINQGRFHSGDYDYVQGEIADIVKAAGDEGVSVKVILEVGYMTDDDIKRACNIAMEAGAAFIKTCTGFGPGRATMHNISLIKGIVGDRMKVKASGGVASLEDQYWFIRAGASRVAGRYNIVEQLQSLGL